MLQSILRLTAVLVTAALTLTAHAAPFMCPSTYQYINIGDTQAKVRATCGEPKTKVEEDRMPVVNEPVTQWFFRIRQREDVNTNQPRLIVVFKDGRVQSLTLGGQLVNSTDLCRKKIAVTSTMKAVADACGKPELINNSEIPVLKKRRKQAVWTYQFGDFSGQVIMTFEDGILKSIQSTR